MIKVIVIGSGNVAQHLISAFKNASEIELIQAVARNKNALSDLLPDEQITDDYSQIKAADLYVIAVADNAIQQVSDALPFSNQLVAHTSGSVAIGDLNNANRKAVFYPLQTFSKVREMNFKTVPICLEAENESDLKLLTTVAQQLSNQVHHVNSEQRKSLHVSAVFVCNFVNHLYKIGYDICKEHELPFAILKPLIQETAAKVMSMNPDDAQTGPARRGDTSTINKHLNFLTDENQREIYQLLTKSIIDYEQKL